MDEFPIHPDLAGTTADAATMNLQNVFTNTEGRVLNEAEELLNRGTNM